MENKERVFTVNTEIISSLHWFFKFLTAHTHQPQGKLPAPHHPYRFSTFDPDPTQFSKVGPREIQKLVLRLLYQKMLIFVFIMQSSVHSKEI